MTASELIAELQKHPPNTLVYVDGYESGIDDVGTVRSVFVRRDSGGREYWEGKHESVIGAGSPGILIEKEERHEQE